MEPKLVFSGEVEEGDFSFYHFDHETFMKAETRSDSPSSRHYLNLGDTFHDWHEGTKVRAMELYELILEESIEFLKTLNPVWATIRHAEILIGHLVRMVAFRISRAEAQASLLPTFSILHHQRIRVHLPKLPPKDFSESYGRLISGHFSQLIEARCLSGNYSTSLEIEVIEREFHGAEVKTHVSKPRRGLYLFLGRALRPFTRHNNVFVLGSYLGRVNELLLNLLLKQAPVLSEIRDEYTSLGQGHPISPKSLLLEAKTPTSLGLEIVKTLLPEFYLRSSADQEARFEELGWPKEPDLIFTSNNFASDAEFMAYLASRISTAKYFVGQHGNGYGVRRDVEPIPEFSACDRFLSWGWGGRKVESFGLLKPPLLSTHQPKYLTLILRAERKWDLAVDCSRLNKMYIDRISTLLRLLGDREVPTQLRFHSSHWDELEEACSDILADYEDILSLAPKTSLRRQLRDGGAAVFTYDSTGMLELAASGGHFLCFPADGLGHVDDRFSANYEQLLSVGLLSRDPVQIASAGERILAKGFFGQDREAIQLFADGIVYKRRNRVIALAKSLHLGAKGA